MTRESADLSQRSLLLNTSQRYWLFLVIFGLFALFFVLGGRSLENKDSVRFAEVAREILEFDDWIILRYGGKIYPDKPALHYWLIAGLYKIFGISPFVARLPEAIAAFCGFLVTFLFTRRIFRSTETAFLAAMILLSSYGYFFWAKRTRIDIELAVFFSVSLFFFYFGVEARNIRTKALWYSGFWMASGLAFMCKGPVAFSNLAVASVCGILTRREPEGRRVAPGLLALTSPIVALPILPWVVPLLKHPLFPAYKQAFNQTVIMHRGFSFFTYFYDFPIRLFPASPFFFLGVWGFIRFRKQLNERRELAFMLLWVGVYVFLLHLTSGKNARYLLPIHMPASIVAAWAIMFFLQKYPKSFGKFLRWSDRIFFCGAALSLIFPLCFAIYFELPVLRALPYVICLGLVLAVARAFLPLKAAGLFLSCIVIFLSIEVADSVYNEKSADYLALSQTLKQQSLTPEQVIFYDCYTGGRAKYAVSYYYDQVIGCSNNFKELLNDTTIKGIVTTRETLEKVNSLSELERYYHVIAMRRDFLLILKPD